MLDSYKAYGAGLRSLAEPWADTTTPAGRMVLTVFAGIAEFERSLIIDRIRTGRQAAQKRGVRFGRREDTVKLPRVQVRLRRRFRHAWKSTVLFTAQRVTGHDVFELFD